MQRLFPKVCRRILLVTVLFLGLLSCTANAYCTVDSDCNAHKGLGYCQIEDGDPVGACQCTELYVYEPNSRNSHAVSDEVRTCHRRYGTSTSELKLRTAMTVLINIMSFISMGFLIKAFKKLYTLKKLGKNLQTIGLLGVSWLAICNSVYWSVDPLNVNMIMPPKVSSYLFWLPDLGVLSSFNLFFLFWRDISSKDLTRNKANRFVTGNGVLYGIIVSLTLLFVILTISVFVLASTIPYMLMYVLYATFCSAFMAVYGYRLNKSLRRGGGDKASRRNSVVTSASGSSSKRVGSRLRSSQNSKGSANASYVGLQSLPNTPRVPSTPRAPSGGKGDSKVDIRKRLNYMAIVAVSLQLAVVVHALQTAVTASFCNSYVILIDMLVAKFIAFLLGLFLIYAFYPKNQVKNNKKGGRTQHFTRTATAKNKRSNGQRSGPNSRQGSTHAIASKISDARSTQLSSQRITASASDINIQTRHKSVSSAGTLQIPGQTPTQTPVRTPSPSGPGRVQLTPFLTVHEKSDDTN